MVDDLQDTLQQATLESHDRLLMALYGLIQHVGSRWEQEGIDLVKQLFKAGENGMQKPDALKKGPMMEKLVELLEHFGFVKDDGDSIVHDQEHFI
ncbi:hypothetical protein GF325_13290 [Candidatus Bathyarchaeota archaeon]|nr:hypothetical protein [Candidatus Bathyarchaeota archaeon]